MNIEEKHSRVNYNYVNLMLYIQNKIIFVKDIFPYNKSDSKKVPKNINDLIFKKLSKNYIDKLSLILHDSIHYKDYYLKRKNLDKAIYKNLDNNKMHLTFKKKFPIKLTKNNINKNNINNISSQNSIIINNPNKTNLESIEEKQDKNIDKTYSLSNDINNVFFNKEDNLSLLKQKKVYDKFKPKFLYYKPKLLSQLKSPFFSHYSEISLNKSKSLSNISSYNNMNNIFKSCNSLKALRDKEKLNENILKNKEKFCEEIKEELIPIKNKKNKKKFFWADYDFFYYDKKKWKNKDENIKNNNDIFIQMNKLLNDNIADIQYRNKFYKEKLLKLEDKNNYMRNSILEFNKYYQ